MSALYLLDTNMVAYIVNRHSEAARIKMAEAIAQQGTIAISAITQGEILYGVARKPAKTGLRDAAEQFFAAVITLPWDSTAARIYGPLRSSLTAAGKTLSPIDLLLAAHAIAAPAILVTHDKAFRNVADLVGVEDWATDMSS